jgi:serine/threonine protein kinase
MQNKHFKKLKMSTKPQKSSSNCTEELLKHGYRALGEMVGEGFNGAVYKICIDSNCDSYVVKISCDDYPKAMREVENYKALIATGLTTYSPSNYGSIAPGLKEYWTCTDNHGRNCMYLVMERWNPIKNIYWSADDVRNVIKIIKVLHNNGFAHRDLHSGNIVYRKSGYNTQFAFVDWESAIKLNTIAEQYKIIITKIYDYLMFINNFIGLDEAHEKELELIVIHEGIYQIPIYGPLAIPNNPRDLDDNLLDSDVIDMLNHINAAMKGGALKDVKIPKRKKGDLNKIIQIFLNTRKKAENACVIDEWAAISEKIDQGNYSEVYVICIPKEKCKFYAILKITDIKNKIGRASMENEIKTLDILKKYSQYFLTLYDYFECYIPEEKSSLMIEIMELLNTKQDVYSFIRNHAKLPKKWWLTIFRQVIEAISILEQNKINHNDLHFKNVLFNKQNMMDNPVIRIIDFGTVSGPHKFNSGIPTYFGKSPSGFVLGRDVFLFSKYLLDLADQDIYIPDDILNIADKVVHTKPFISAKQLLSKN